MATSVQDFISTAARENSKLVAVTSGGFHSIFSRPSLLMDVGGTTVNLEQNTVRYIDNFSSGERGALSAEWVMTRS